MQDNKELKKIIADRVKKARLERKLTRENVVEMANISEQTLKKIENAQTDCKSSTLLGLSKALNVSADYLIGNCDISDIENLNFMFNSLTEEKRIFAEAILYQIKSTPFEFKLLTPEDNKE